MELPIEPRLSYPGEDGGAREFVLSVDSPKVTVGRSREATSPSRGIEMFHACMPPSNGVGHTGLSSMMVCRATGLSLTVSA